MEKILIEYEVEMGKLKTQMNAVQKELKDTEKAGEDAAKGISEEFNNAGEKTKSLNAQLRQLKRELASATDPKEIERLAKAAGKLTDQIQDAAEAAKVFASESKFEQVSTAIGGIGRKILSLDFSGALEQSRLFLSVSKSINFKEAIGAVKDLGSTLLNIGRALLANPLFLIGGAIALIATNWDRLKSLFSESEKELRRLNAAYEEQKRITAEIVSASERRVKLLEAEGAGLKEIYLERLKGLDAQLAELKALYQLNAAKLINAKSTDTLTEASLKYYAQLLRFQGRDKEAKAFELGYYAEKKKKEQEATDAQKAAQEQILNLINDVNILRINYDKKVTDEQMKNAKELADYQKALRDLRVQNLADGYEKERQIIENRFADEASKYQGQTEILLELKRKRDLELLALDGKYGKLVIAEAEKLVGLLNEVRSNEEQQIQRSAEIELNYFRAKNAEKVENEKITAEQIKGIQNDLFNFTSKILSDIVQIQANRTQSEIQDIDYKTQKEKEALDNSLKRNILSKESYDKKVAELDKRANAEKAKAQKKQFDIQKQASIIQATIATAQGIVNAFTVQPAYLAIAQAAIAAATGAAQIAVIASQPTPKFAKGGEIRGRLHSEGGTLIEAEKGEYVINRKDTRTNKGLLSAINKGLSEKYIHEMYIAPALKAQYKEYEKNKNKSFADNIANSMIFNTGKFNDKNLVESLKTSRRAERNNFEELISVIKSNRINRRDIV